MCGIAGIYSPAGSPIDPQVLKRMGDVIAHRGPDDDRYLLWSAQNGHRLSIRAMPQNVTDATLGFAHRRLGIIDLGGGGPPKLNHERNLVVCYNSAVFRF